MQGQLYQDARTGQRYTLINQLDDQFLMVKGADGTVTTKFWQHLIPVDPDTGKLDRNLNTIVEIVEPDEPIPPSLFPKTETRLDLNRATAEEIAQVLKGIVSYPKAKQIVELRQSLSGERFENFDSLRSIPRVNWDAVIEANLVYLG